MLSIIVVTKNEEAILKVCLESAKWADELIVVDDESTDKTREIAKEFTDKVYVHKMEDFASQRNYAIEQATGDWVFYLDADERITALLREELQKITCQAAPEVTLYDVPRRNFWLGVEQKYAGGWPDNVVRLIKRDAFNGWQGKLHEHPESKGKLGHLQQPLIHLTHRDVTSMVLKTASWATKEAQLRFDANHPPMSGWRFLRICTTFFYKWYIKKQGYKGGTEGTIESIYQTFSFFIAYVRLWEMQQQPSLAEKYQAIDQELLATNFTKP